MAYLGDWIKGEGYMDEALYNDLIIIFIFKLILSIRWIWWYIYIYIYIYALIEDLKYVDGFVA